MINKKHIFITILLLITRVSLFSQNFIVKGQITDKDNSAIQFANVVLQDRDGKYLIGATSNQSGEYFLEGVAAGIYDLIITFIGFETYQETITLNSDVEKNIILIEKTNELQEIVISASRPNIVLKNDRYEVNIENSIAAKGNSIETLLRKLPGVWTTNDGVISINGVQGSRVMINNRLIKLSGNTLMKYLKSFRSENISKIEVIQNPSSEFDAEGSGGIIRIITKKNESEGIQLTISNTSHYQKFLGFAPFFSMNYKNRKFGANITFNAEKTRWLLLSNNIYRNKETNVEFNTQGSDTIYDKNYSFSTDLFYTINKRNNMSLNFNSIFWGKNEYMASQTNIIGLEEGNAIHTTNTNHQEYQAMRNYSITYNYDVLFDDDGNKKISIISDYVKQPSYNTKSYFFHRNYYANNQIAFDENLYNNQQNPYELISSEIKYTDIINSANRIITGIKYSNSTIENSLSSYLKSNNNWILNEEYGYSYKYNEKLVSAFIQYNYIKNKWSTTAGIRGEYSNSNIENSLRNRENFNLFPSIFLNYNLNQYNLLGLSFTRRIQRVSYMSLIPRRYYTSRYSIIEGNPNLTPNIVNSIGLTYKLKNKYYLSISYRWGRNYISRFNSNETIGEDNIIVSSYIDGITANLLNMNYYIPIKIGRWWNITNQLNLNYDNYKTPSNSINGFNYNIYTRHEWSLPWGMRSELLYRFQSESKRAYMLTHPYHLLNFTLQKSFMKENLLVKFEANRILYNQKMISETITSNNESKSIMYYTKSPFFSLTLSYSLNYGKKVSFKKIQRSNEQEKTRTF